jgi:hypothetical protein
MLIANARRHGSNETGGNERRRENGEASIPVPAPRRRGCGEQIAMEDAREVTNSHGECSLCPPRLLAKSTRPSKYGRSQAAEQRFQDATSQCCRTGGVGIVTIMVATAGCLRFLSPGCTPIVATTSSGPVYDNDEASAKTTASSTTHSFLPGPNSSWDYINIATVHW